MGSLCAMTGLLAKLASTVIGSAAGSEIEAASVVASGASVAATASDGTPAGAASGGGA
jgi:hypothetical protein